MKKKSSAKKLSTKDKAKPKNYSLPKIDNLDISKLRGKRVLLRLDLNVPIAHNQVLDDFRIQMALPTVRWLLRKQAKVFIVSHASDGLKDDGSQSLEPVADRLRDSLPVTFIEHFNDFNLIRTIGNGECAMFENVRRENGELADNVPFSKTLAGLGDLYVNEAFSVSHRQHASVVGVTRYLPSYAGPLFQEEVTELSKILAPNPPFLFILGGAKFSTKVPLVKKYLKIADQIFIGGALAHVFFKARGLEIGRSTADEVTPEIQALVNQKKIMLPIDVMIEGPRGIELKRSTDIGPEDKIIDAGPLTLGLLEEKIKTSKTILWNGPLGLTSQGASGGTKELARLITRAKAHSVVGGGDTVAAIRKMKLLGRFGFVSTGGGAMLDFLAKGTLPGIEALKKSSGF